MSSPAIRSVEFKANYTCNSACGYCCSDNRKEERTMAQAEILANIDYFVDRYAIEEVCLSGGEPTVHPDFKATLAAIHAKRLSIYLHTNGINFHKADFAEYCARYLNRVLIGYSAHTTQLCETLTATGKSLWKREAGVKNLLALGVPLRTNTVIVKENYQALPEIAEKIHAMGVKRTLFTLPFFFHGTTAQIDAYIPERFDLFSDYLRTTIDYLLANEVSVALQGIPACKLGEFAQYAEIDQERGFVDSQFQFERHNYLFSGMLGYDHRPVCDSCDRKGVCWGFPKPQAMGALGGNLDMPQ